jgi:hypothetical protein
VLGGFSAVQFGVCLHRNPRCSSQAHHTVSDARTVGAQHRKYGARSRGTSFPEKWDKTKSMIRELATLLQAHDDEKLPLKRLEQIRGFLIYVSRTYEWMPPYLKGLHLTIDSWREGRNRAGCLGKGFGSALWDAQHINGNRVTMLRRISRRAQIFEEQTTS